jgi:RNA polymerase sigma-70 factor (ECF subfamily)
LIDEIEKEKIFERALAENKARIQHIARVKASGDLCQDLEQEILFELWKSLDRYEGRSSLATWVYRVTINTAREFNRRNRREPISVSLSAESASTSGNTSNRDPEQILDEFIRSLGVVDRMVLLMYLDDLDYHEMSEAINVGEPSLRVRVGRLKKQFTDRYIGT